MSLHVSRVPRSLETKPKLFGFALGDLLLLFSYLSVSNLIFGTTFLKFPVVWVGTFTLGCTLYFVKRGKPDNYVEDYAEFLRKPDCFFAAAPDTEYRPLRNLKQP